jgi:5-methylcytosine-specific restriction endonuclease McrA
MRPTKKERELIFKKYEGHCAYCGCELQKGYHIDHLEPVLREWWKKGSPMYKPENDTKSNLMPSCPSCNINKHSLSLENFRKLIENFIVSLNKNSTQYKIAKRYGLIIETKIEVVFYFEEYEKIYKHNNDPTKPWNFRK